MKALILSLAAARLTQLVVDDEITEPVRNAIEERSRGNALTEEIRSVSGQVIAGPEARQPWTVLNEIVNCHACSSVWAGAGVLIAEQTGVGRFLVRVLALSQAALAVKAVIERIDR